jgi:hypothetical protein
MQRYPKVIRRTSPRDFEAIPSMEHLVISPLEPAGEGLTRFDVIPPGQDITEVDSGGFELVLDVRDTWDAAPGAIITATSRVPDPQMVGTFVERCHNIFEARREIESFAFDWLLKKTGGSGDEFLVVGAYGTEDGARRLSLEHPAVLRAIERNPVDAFENVGGFPLYRVVEAGISLPRVPNA